MSENILSLDTQEIKEFFLKNESYINADLPLYIDFADILKQSEKAFRTKKGGYKKLSDLQDGDPKGYENLNYHLFSNKDGSLDWRRLELINPVVYVSLVLAIAKNWDAIKSRINKLTQKSCVKCMSLPAVSATKKKDKAEQILNWWEEIEQKSLELALEYDYLYHTDITNCYGSLYTHSIPWALHSKKKVKSKKYRTDKNRTDKSLIGNQIDAHLQQMSYGQTNGIPQGSVLMDFIAEIVLLYVDSCFTLKLKKLYGKDVFSKLEILRYRDDYRIFTSDKRLAEDSLKELSKVMTDFGFKLNSSKTIASENVITGSIKKDKLNWLILEKEAKTIQKKLLILYIFLQKNKNCGTSVKYLQEIYDYINKNNQEIKKENIAVIISIIVNITYENPRTYPVCMAILSSLFSYIDSDVQKQETFEKIINKFKKLPNSGYLEIWLQRAIIGHTQKKVSLFNENICKLVDVDKDVLLWNFDWLKSNVKDDLSKVGIIANAKVEGVKPIIENEEFNIFEY